VGFAEIGVSEGIIRVEDDSLANPFHRDVVAARLVSDHAEEVQRVGMVWLHRKYLAVERFGLRQPPRAVGLKRHLKCLWNGHSLNLRHSLSRARFSVIWVRWQRNSCLISFPYSRFGALSRSLLGESRA